MMYSRKEEAEKRRFYWQTQNPYIVSKEKVLLTSLAGLDGIILEVGCGEGANLVNLRNMGFKAFYYGVDFSFEKVKFASLQNNANVRFICGDAVNLPFKNEVFNAVLLRDLLHHIDSDRETALREALRVCQRASYIFIIEGNGSKFTNRLFRLITPGESGMKNSTRKNMENLLRRLQIDNICINMKEPFSLFRFFLHYRYGVGVFGKMKCIRLILDLMEKIAARIITENKRAYITAAIKK